MFSRRKEVKTIYYKDEINDDFARNKIIVKKLPNNFKYITKNPFFVISSFFLYWFIAKPLAFLICKIHFRQRFVNKKILKKYHKTGYFFFINHTDGLLDALLPNIACYMKRTYIITSPAATSIPIVKRLVVKLGGIPIGTDLSKVKDMVNCVKKRISNKNIITIYPEAHIWPYYNKIRPFPNNSFRFVVNNNVPMFTITNCYQKRKWSKKPKVLSYVDGPFLIDENFSLRDNMVKLRNDAYETMCKRAKFNSTYEYIKYIKG